MNDKWIQCLLSLVLISITTIPNNHNNFGGNIRDIVPL